MARSLKDLANELRATADDLDKAASDAACQVAIAIVTDLATKTPVDTSKALSNWRIGLGRPVALAIAPHNPGRHGSTQDASAAATIAQAKAALAAKKPGQTIWISNVLPYIRRLNDGYSRQAPAGFVERAILIGRKVSETVKITLGRK
jgi:hypothetical protein